MASPIYLKNKQRKQRLVAEAAEAIKELSKCYKKVSKLSEEDYEDGHAWVVFASVKDACGLAFTAVKKIEEYAWYRMRGDL